MTTGGRRRRQAVTQDEHGGDICPAMAACAAAATALSASCSGEAAGPGNAGPVPPITPSWNIAKQRISSARNRRRRSQPRGRRRHAQVRADPRAARPAQRCRQAGADHLDRIGAAGRAPRRQHDVRAPAGAAAGTVRPQPHGPSASSPITRSRPCPTAPAAPASTSCRMLTVSSRWKTDISRPTRTGMLTPDDASSLPPAQKERRGTARGSRVLGSPVVLQGQGLAGAV